jgi:hypothetical protein
LSTLALKSQTIGTIRRFVSSHTTRDGLKELLLEGGADADRILKLTVTNNARSSAYLSGAELLNEGFDTIYQDFEKPEADGILIRMVGILLGRRSDPKFLESIPALENGLSFSGLSVSRITEATEATVPLETASQQAQVAQLQEATTLLAKGLRRLTTDRPGAITACTSACESVCRIALERLAITLPAGKTLPDYFQTLCQQTNLEALARVSGDDAKKVFTSLRGLAQNLYQAAHELGDRHAHGENAHEPTPLATELLATSCAAITTVVAGALARDELKAINPPTKNS